MLSLLPARLVIRVVRRSEEVRVDARLVGTWRIEAVASRTGDYEDPNLTWTTVPADTEQGERLGAVAHTFRADGTGQIGNRGVPARSPEQFTWRVEDEGGQLYLTLDSPLGPISMRVWLRPDGWLVWEQNVFSRRIEGRRVWFNPASRQWVGREWLSQFSGWAAFVLARDAAATADKGEVSAEPGGAADRPRE
jgi:hypothetical protein